jgi:ABC-2 type transport system ATP-binding protein
MDFGATSEVAGPPEVTPLVDFEGVSKWYGNVIGLNKLTLRIPAGVTGLLGPNGAGKSTLLQLATGQLRPSQGTVRVLGQAPWNNPRLMRHVGLCPEQDAFWEWMTGFDFVRTCARLTGMSRRGSTVAAEKAMATVGMSENMGRPIRGYSKGMRQRTKLAQALVHGPQVLFLDEPFTGTDPVARRDLIDVIRGLGAAGHSVLVSSHVLYEVQALTQNIVLLHRGRLVAEGNVRQIRDLIDQHPHRIVLVCDDYRAVAAQVVGWDDVEGVKIMGRDGAESGEALRSDSFSERRTNSTRANGKPTARDGALLVETRWPDDFYGRLTALVAGGGVRIREVYSEDDNLEAVFKYLVSR